MNPPRRILILYGESWPRTSLETAIASMGHESAHARDTREALTKARQGIDLVLIDSNDSNDYGVEAARRLREELQEIELPILLLIDSKCEKERIRALEAGVDDFVSKPIDSIELTLRTSLHLKMKSTHEALRRCRREMKEDEVERTALMRVAIEELSAAQRLTQNAHLETVHRLALAAEYKDQHTASHIKRMGDYCAVLARALGMRSDEVDVIFHASPMHDVGKLGIPDDFLLKPGRLDPDEWEIMKRHTIIGGEMLGGSRSKLLQTGEAIALTHHERWDGSGYPNGLAGEEIPVCGRICAVADVFDALTSPRPYKKAFANEDSYAIMRTGRARHFDPDVLDVFFENIAEVEEIQERYRHEEALAALAT